MRPFSYSTTTIVISLFLQSPNLILKAPSLKYFQSVQGFTLLESIGIVFLVLPMLYLPVKYLLRWNTYYVLESSSLLIFEFVFYRLKNDSKICENILVLKNSNAKGTFKYSQDLKYLLYHVGLIDFVHLIFDKE